MDVKETLKEYSAYVENALYSFLPPGDIRQGEAVRAALHSLSAGGKRIRPVLTLRFCEMCGGSREAALPAACALEYMHTFSLIHDDLPCMDDDDMRRGKPSCHKAFGEATALLAGDALAVMPFGMIADAARSGRISDAAAVKVISLLAEQVGFLGMIGGQQIDTENDGCPDDPDGILEMYSLKTSALLKAACAAGVYCAQSAGEEKYISAALGYAENMGLAFQLVDDILDITGDEKILGKPTGSDKRSDKHTYAALCGLDAAKKKAAEYTEKALSELEKFPDNEFIVSLTKTLLDRNS